MPTRFFVARSSPSVDALGYIEKPAKRRWTPETGWTTVRTWRGPASREAQFLATKGFNSLNGIDVEYDGDIAEITLNFVSLSQNPYDDNAAQKDPMFVGWTLSGNSIQSELSSKAGFGFLEPADAADSRTLGWKLHDQIIRMQRLWKYDVDEAIAAKTYPLKADGSAFNVYAYALQITDPVNSHRQGRARYLFLQQLNKNDHWETSQPVLRKIETLRSNSAEKRGMDYVNRFFTWAALKLHEPTIDPAIILSITSLDAADTTYQYYWRKRMPVLDIGGDGKRQITVEYWAYEAYDKFIYGDPITKNGGALYVPPWPNYGNGTAPDPFEYYNRITAT